MQELQQLKALTESLQLLESPEENAEHSIWQLRKCSKELPAVFADADDFIDGWFTDLPMNSSEQLTALEYIVKQPIMQKIDLLWKKNHNYDLLGTLKSELQNIKDEFS